ncbi:MAG: class I SAM-dependent rRNA methyltransferase [Candidatus Saccharimonas sp.]|nr:class I SAM-dependent rRNA methyltransferase [Planctomycetaceae bacterium]
MPLIQSSDSPVVLRLNRDLARTIKRGHPWVYADALRELPRAGSGSPAVLLDNRKGQPVAVGFYDPASPLAFRVCDADGGTKLDDRWAERRLRDALALRRSLFNEGTTGFRLLNGEGDGLPGLVIDVYGHAAVMKLDGAGPCGFWDAPGIAAWLAELLTLKSVYERRKERGSEGRALVGPPPKEPVHFLEYGLKFTADIVKGQKTGFFLDQRDNRHTIRQLARGRSILNLFAYTGGFSVAAGCGGAKQVTTVDLAKPAIDVAVEHWRLNELLESAHEAVATDAFEFLDETARSRRRWDIVVVDPPSFAPNQESVSKAKAAYQTLIAGGARVTAKGGLLAAASCSSHIDLPMFLALCEEGVSEARRRATVLGIHGQPADHPTPLVLPEFRYLKFVLMRVE